MKELRSEDSAEEFSKAMEKAASVGDEYKGLLRQIHRYMRDNGVDWFDPHMIQFRSSVMAIFASTATAVEDMNCDG